VQQILDQDGSSSQETRRGLTARNSLRPVLPLSLGRADRYGFEFCRHDILSIYAAFEVTSGQTALQRDNYVSPEGVKSRYWRYTYFYAE
jgi:hypothetical protein